MKKQEVVKKSLVTLTLDVSCAFLVQNIEKSASNKK